MERRVTLKLKMGDGEIEVEASGCNLEFDGKTLKVSPGVDFTIQPVPQPHQPFFYYPSPPMTIGSPSSQSIPGWTPSSTITVT